MPYTPSKILTGVNPNTNFLLELDTKQRMANLFQDYKQPVQYNIPDFVPDYDTTKGLSQDSILDLGSRDDIIKKALRSTDPKIKESALKTIFNTPNQAIQAGVGRPANINYYPWQDKYLNDEFGYNPNLDQKGNEEFYYNNQWAVKSGVGKILSTITKFVPRVVLPAILKFGEGLGYVGAMAFDGVRQAIDLIPGVHDDHNFMASVSENAFSRSLQNMEENLKNSSLLSVYKPADWENKSFFSKLTNGAMWTDEFADGIAFLASAAIPAGALGRAGKGVSLLSKESLAWTKAMRYLGTETLGDVGSVVYNTTMESAMEAADGFRTYKQELKNKRRDGEENFANLSDEEIDRMAGNAAASRFRWNLAVLSVSNLFENKFIFKPLANRIASKATRTSERVGAYASLNEAGGLESKEIAKGLFGRFMGKMEGKAINTMARIPFYGKRFLQASVMEGLWEENAQLAIERWSTQSPYENSKGDSIQPERQLWRQYLKQTKAALTGKDRKNETSIGLGALIGIFGTGVVAKTFGGSDKNGNFKFLKGERRTQIDNAKKTIEDYNDAFHNMLSINDIYNTDARGDKSIDEEKVKKKLNALNVFGKRQITIEQIKDPILRNKLQQDLFAEYMAAAVHADVHDGLIARLNNLLNVPAEKLKSLGLDATEVFGSPKKYAERGKQLIEEYQKIHASSTIKNKTQSFKDYDDKEAKRKYIAYIAYSRMKSSEDAQLEFEDAAKEKEAAIKSKFDALSIDYPIHLNQLAKFNRLSLERKGLEQAISEFEFFGHDIVARNAKARIRAIEKEQKQIRKELTDLKLDERLSETKLDSKYPLLIDTKINKEVEDAHMDLFVELSKDAQLRIDVDRNAVLWESLKDEKDGQKAYDEYLEYLGKRKTTETIAEEEPDKDIVQQEIDELEERKKALQKLKDLQDTSMSNEEIDAELNAIEEEQKKKQSLIVEESEEEIIPEPEDNRFHVEIDGVKYYNMQELAAASIGEGDFNAAVEAFTAQALKLYDEQQSEEEKLRLEEEREEFDLTEDEFIQHTENSVNLREDEFEFVRYETPFGTETKGSEDELNNAITEILHPNSYVSALNASINIPIEFDLYEPIIVKDREEWLDRFPPAQREKVIANNEIGIVLVFRKRGTTSEFLTIGEHIEGARYSATIKAKPIIHSINDPRKDETGFEAHLDKSARILARKRRMSLKEVHDFYREEQATINQIRHQILDLGTPIIYVNAYVGGTGIIPFSYKSDTIMNRFNDFKPEFVLITKENVDRHPGAILGAIYATFPGNVARESEAKEFSGYAPTISLITATSVSDEDIALAEKIRSVVNDLINGNKKFSTKEAAIKAVAVFGEKVIYTSADKAKLRVVKEKDHYIVQYVKLDDEGEKVITSIAAVRLNVNNKIYLGEDNLLIPNEENEYEIVPSALYKSFIDNRIRTSRKIIKKGDGKLFLDPINSYYNLEYIKQPEESRPVIKEKSEESIDTEPAVKQEIIPISSQEPEITTPETTSFNLDKINIDLGGETPFINYRGSRNPKDIQTNIDNFIVAATELQVTNPSIVFGRYDISKTYKVYFFGSKEIGTFALFEHRNGHLNQILNEEKFAKQHPAIYEEIKNQCK